MVWVYLLAFRDEFWRADQHLPPRAGTPSPDADVVAVMPARDEADVIGSSVASLLQQKLVPPIRLVLVDDESSDDTRQTAREAARQCGAADRLTVVSSAPRPPGWTGKMWATAQGVRVAAQLAPRYLLLTDADIRHDPDVIRALVMKAEAEKLDLASLMVRLHCCGLVERLLIPAFVFFFQKLYPFRAVNDPARRTAAAAGGCMLVRTEALQRAGGIEAVHDALIDDCALARRIKSTGPIWLGLTDRSVSLRAYGGISAIWHMVARSAYTQLGFSRSRLLGTVLGMILAYLSAPGAVLIGLGLQGAAPLALGTVAWFIMGVAYAPTLKLYGLSPLWVFSLPVSAFLYTMMTVDSARRHWLGQGGVWKGRLNGGLMPAMDESDEGSNVRSSLRRQSRRPFSTEARAP